MRWSSLTAVSATLAIMGCVSTAAYAGAGNAQTDQAKLTKQQARAKALNLEHGKIKSGELEKESGGSGLRYSFDIQTSNGLREVGIDAVTGKVLENSHESPQAEARESRNEDESASASHKAEAEDQDQDRNGSNGSQQAETEDQDQNGED